MSDSKPDLSPLLPDDATLEARRAVLVDAVASGEPDPQPSSGWSRRVPRLALGAAMALAVVVAVLVFRAGGDPTPAAFAVEPREGGGVRIRVYSLEDAAGLEEALRDAGIRAQVTWLRPGMTCDETRFAPSVAKLPGGGSLGGVEMGGPGTLTISVASTQSARRNPQANINLDPAAFGPDQSVVLYGSPKPFGGDPEGGYEAHFQVAEGPVPPCKAVSAPAGSVGSIPVPPGAEAKLLDLTPPGPGQFLYTKTKVLQLQGWDADGPGAGTKADPRYFTANLLGPESNALPARVSTLKEVWMERNGTTREREALDGVEFLSAADQKRWEEAGSPPPFAYDPAEHQVKRDAAGRPLKEYASRSWRGSHEFANLPKLSRLSTEPAALRQAIENQQEGSPSASAAPASSERGGATAERLLEILAEPITSSALRAAAIGALAEIPGIELQHDVVDGAGRRGDAIAWNRERGFGHQIIFDPHSFDLLSEAEVIFNAKAAEYPGVPDGTVYRETVYLGSGIVDSDHERPSHAGH
ncbi:MAG: hypothetical protein ACTHNY_06545 [Solirubrobacterales bacterium]